ncbi:MAG: hypothetical protein KC503_10340 [Myxococcales bacterium]|nr:hypothetical protein [Myxococcales bacterium]
MFVDAVRPADLRSWMAMMRRTCPCGQDWRKVADGKCGCGRRQPYGAPTVNGWLRVLRVVFDDAVADGIAAMNPARVVKSLPEGKTSGRRGTALTVVQFQAALRAITALRHVTKRGEGISADVSRMLLVSAWTGVRRGELMALRWTDMVDSELHIERSVYRRGEKATKTDDPRRVTIVAPLAVVLAEQRRWLIETQHPGVASGLVFPASPQHAKAGATRRDVDEVSWYRSPSVLDEPLRRVVKEASIPAISPQSFGGPGRMCCARRASINSSVARSRAGVQRRRKASTPPSTAPNGTRRPKPWSRSCWGRRSEGAPAGTPGWYTRAEMKTPGG